MTDYDALIVGGGPGGLSAGLWLARYRRRVRILDSGKPRNEPTWAVHGYPGITDPPPHELRRVLLEQATAAGAEWEGCEVVDVSGEKDHFTIRQQGGTSYTARRIILAYGRRDVIPDIEGLEPLYGKSVFHCPDCDGPPMLDVRVGVYGWNRNAAILALYLLTWAREVTLLTNANEPKLETNAYAALAKYGIEIKSGKIARLCAHDDRLAAVEFTDGDALPLDGFFFQLGSEPAADLADELGCERDEDRNLQVDGSHETSVTGVFGAGDLLGGPYLAITAAAKGVRTALAVHRSLLPADHDI